ncbi:MAG: purine nucleoside permease [Pseudomonadota bacterium]
MAIVRCLNLVVLVTLAFVLWLPPNAQSGEILPVRVVVVTMIAEWGDRPGRPGELKRWVEDYPLPEVLDFPIGNRNLHYSPDRQVLAVNTGLGTARAATSVTALGLDPRFDLSKAYWIVAGIAGANPKTATVGAAVWAEWVVDGDLAHEIDAREIPPDWPTGYTPLSLTTPYQLPVPDWNRGTVYRLNPMLVDWAYGLTKDIALPDSPSLAAWRAKYARYPAAQKAPHVLRGDTLSASTFWHGTLFNDWAEDWVSYWTKGAGTFATSAMEDTGTMAALTHLAKAGRVDLDRVLILRTTSNFTTQHAGTTAAQSLADEGRGQSARVPAVNAAFAVGRVVVDALVDGWARYEAVPPAP